MMDAINLSSDTDSDSDASFHSLHEEDEQPTPAIAQPPTQPTTINSSTQQSKPRQIERFLQEEEASLLSESQKLKTAGNSQFGSGSYSSAIQTYDRALASCPNYLDFELAVLRSNIAACHVKLEEWKEATESAEEGIQSLENLEPLPQTRTQVKHEGKADEVEEVDEGVAERIENLRLSGHTLDEVRKLQVKLLMRRAKARSQLGGWSTLQGADEDYRMLLSPTMLPCLSPTDRRTVSDSAQRLVPRLNAAKEKEMADMMDKLKGLGNSILKPFGLSTNNFQFVKDEKTGGYSMNFDQNAKKS